MAPTKSAPAKDALPAFDALPEAEQRAIAERLIRIQESGWKPFWCSNPDCDGMPDSHPLTIPDPFGQEPPAVRYMPMEASEGPHGEPLGKPVYTQKGQYKVCLGRPVLDPKWAHNHGRADQRLPGWNQPWTLFIMSGRGSGKTKIGTEFVTLNARKGLDGAIVGRRGTELVNTHVKRLIEEAHPEFVPEHFASKDILVWPNGAVTYLFSAERPENIRSVNLSYAWVDEAAWMDEIESAWSNLKLAARVKSEGNPIHILITSTPTGTPWVMKMEDDPGVIVRRVSTYANRANLDPGFLAELEKEYEGTRLGRQELHGEVLRDVEGALWNDDMFSHLHLGPNEFDSFIDGLDDCVVAVDPAGSKGKRSDATGIVAVGAHRFDDDGKVMPVSAFSVLLDATLKGTPNEWAKQVYDAAKRVKARRIIAEKNFGGDMVKQVLDDYASLNPETTCDHEGEPFKVEVVRAVQGKETRAEGVVGRYEKGRVTHITGPGTWRDLSMLEKEQVTWVPKSRGGKMPSPNRIDAMVWGVKALDNKTTFAATTASHKDVAKKMKRRR